VKREKGQAGEEEGKASMGSTVWEMYQREASMCDLRNSWTLVHHIGMVSLDQLVHTHSVKGVIPRI